MKKLVAIILILFTFPVLLSAQILNPVKWSYSAKKIGNNQYILHIKASIDNGWHLYAQDAGEGPVPTRFKFDKNPKIALKGKTREVGKLLKDFDKNFNSVLKFYKDSVDFVQYVEVKPGVSTVKGTLEYMVCDNVQCLPPKDIDFSIRL